MDREKVGGEHERYRLEKGGQGVGGLEDRLNLLLLLRLAISY